MIFSFENTVFEYDRAHNGKLPIYFKRVAQCSNDFAFNFLDLVKVPISADIGLHTHKTDNQELYIIVSGTGKMIVNDVCYNVKSGDVIVNPIGGSHSLVNDGKGEMLIVVLEITNPNASV